MVLDFLQSLVRSAARGLSISETQRKACPGARAVGRSCLARQWLRVFEGSLRQCQPECHCPLRRGRGGVRLGDMANAWSRDSNVEHMQAGKCQDSPVRCMCIISRSMDSFLLGPSMKTSTQSSPSCIWSHRR